MLLEQTVSTYICCPSPSVFCWLYCTHIQWWSATVKALTVKTKRNHLRCHGVILRCKSLDPDILRGWNLTQPCKSRRSAAPALCDDIGAPQQGNTCWHIKEITPLRNKNMTQILNVSPRITLHSNCNKWNAGLQVRLGRHASGFFEASHCHNCRKQYLLIEILISWRTHHRDIRSADTNQEVF